MMRSTLRRLSRGLPLAWVLVVAACARAPATGLLLATPTPPPPQATETSTSMPTASATPSATPTAPATPDPYAGLTVDDLIQRSYGGGSITVYDQWRANASFSRALFSYPSDGLTVHGFMNMPRGPGPFPIVMVLHGYVNPAVYRTLSYTSGYADALAKAGYLVLHPNYRNYPPSEVGPNPFRIGYAIDVLNLIALVEQEAGTPGPLVSARPGPIGLLGHSMGGGIALRVVTVKADLDAAVLYGAMSGDEARNFKRILEWSGGRAGWEELNTPPEDLLRISPIHHLDRIQAAVSIHHGEDDAVVPPEWSQELCQRLIDLRKPVECFFYEDQPHTFIGDGEALFLDRVGDFFARALGAG